MTHFGALSIIVPAALGRGEIEYIYIEDGNGISIALGLQA